VCQRIVTVEHGGSQRVSCIFEGNDEAVAWVISSKNLTLEDANSLLGKLIIQYKPIYNYIFY
jgi:hypothetical protein